MYRAYSVTYGVMQHVGPERSLSAAAPRVAANCSCPSSPVARSDHRLGPEARGDGRHGEHHMRRAAGGHALPVELSPDAAREAVESAFSDIRAELDSLVRIPSVSADGSCANQVRRSAEATASWLERAGLDGVRLLEVDGAHPAVFGSTKGPAGTPTVLLYAHHDVQPPGSEELWDSPPFEPTERSGRLFGRGTADDKAGIAVHAATLQVWKAKPPVGVAVFIEGEEETGSAHLPGFLDQYEDLLRADAIVLADCTNWTVGQPTLTTSVRGILDCLVEVRTLDHAVHSGRYGGPVPDAITALCRLIATLHDDEGCVTVRGLRVAPPYSLPFAESDLRHFAGLRPGVRILGSGSLADRLWAQPAIAVLGIDAPPTADAAHKLVPAATARISIRLAPDDDTQQAFRAVEEHLRANAPWGAEIQVSRYREGKPHRIDVSGRAFEAFRRACTDTWGRAPYEPGSGGSLPLAAALAATYPDTALLLTGVEDFESNTHGENESVHLGELRNCCTNEVMLLAHLAALG
jgi:acetylornithine deacetylase/succinyl-diaminopimelate desuccinylase-like protein